MTKPDGEFGFVDITLGAQFIRPHQAADEGGGHGEAMTAIVATVGAL